MFYRGIHSVLPVQHRRMCRFLVTMFLVLSAYLFIAGEGGFYKLWHRDSKIQTLRWEIQELEEANILLQKEVVLLEGDLEMIERIARERYGMVKSNESIYMVYPYSIRDSLRERQ